MRLRNKMKQPLKMVIRTNMQETVDIMNVEGQVTGKKPALPKLKTIHIGQGAEVEIDDVDWYQVWAAKGKAVAEFDEVEEEHLELKGKDNKPLALIKREATKMKTVFIYREMVKKGQIEITEKPKPQMSKKEMVAAISEAIGIEFKPKDEAHLIEMFDKVVG
jgi:hypothetical protein